LTFVTIFLNYATMVYQMVSQRCKSGILIVFQLCYNGFHSCCSGVSVETEVFQWCSSGVPVVLQCCFSGHWSVSVVFQWCCSCVSVVFQLCFIGAIFITMVFQKL